MIVQRNKIGEFGKPEQRVSNSNTKRTKLIIDVMNSYELNYCSDQGTIVRRNQLSTDSILS